MGVYAANNRVNKCKNGDFIGKLHYVTRVLNSTRSIGSIYHDDRKNSEL